MPPPCNGIVKVLGNYLHGGDGLLCNGRSLKRCETHGISGRVAEDLARLDSYVCAKDIDSAAMLQRQGACNVNVLGNYLQRGDGRMFEKVHNNAGTHTVRCVIVNAA